MTGRQALITIVVGIAVSSTSCGAHMQTVAREQGTVDLICPQDLTRAWFRAPGTYLVRGCGRAAEYQCQEREDGPRCTLQGEAGPWKPRELPVRPLGLASEADIVFDVMGPRIAACLKVKRPIRIRAEALFLGSDDLGDVRVAADEEQCIRKVIASTEMPPAFKSGGWDGDPDEALAVTTAIGQAVFTVRSDFPAPRPQPTAAQPTAAPTPAASAVSPPSPQPGIEERIRDTIKNQAEALLMCVNKPMAVVNVTYSASGEVQSGVRDVEAGSAEDRCVHDVLKTLSVEANPSGGAIIQVIRSEKGQ